MRWRSLTRWFHRRADNDFAAEIESHLEMEVDRLVRGGMSADEARHLARRTFGNQTIALERFHDAKTGATLESLAQDIRYGLRTMRRSPGFTAIAVASLAVGIGANTTMFGAVDTLLLRTPPHIRDASSIQRVYIDAPGSNGRLTSSLSYG